MKSILYFLVTFSLLFTACKKEKERMIIGKWQAAKLVECDNTVPIQTDLVSLEFTNSGKYVFNSTLNIREEGVFSIKKDYLFTKDKSRPNAPEKVVLIKQLSKDSLVLEMNYKGKEQWLTLLRLDEASSISKTSESDNKAKTLVASTENTQKNANTDTTKTQPAEATKLVAEAKPTEETRNKEEKKEEKKTEKKEDSDKISAAEAYRRREEKRKKEEAEQKAEERARYEAYMKREIKRKKEEIDRKEALRERAEANRKKKPS